MGIVDSAAYDSEESVVEAAVRLGEQLVKRKQNNVDSMKLKEKNDQLVVIMRVDLAELIKSLRNKVEKIGAYEQAFKLDIVWDDGEESDTEIEPLVEGMAKIKLSKETKARIRALWAKALIVKVFGRIVGFDFLTFKINALWRSTAKMDSIKPLEPCFRASGDNLTSVAVWVRFPELPIEFYDLKVLKEIGSAIELVLRIDSYTATGSRGSYAKLCTQVDIEKPLINSIRIGRMVQQVLYEGISSLCFCCGRFSSTGQSYMGLDPQPLVGFHHRHISFVLGGDEGIEQAEKAICDAPLRQIRVVNPGKEVGGFQGNGNSSHGESPNAKASADFSSCEDMRHANLLQGGCRGNLEVFNGLETEMEEFQGPIEEVRMESGGSSSNKS
nr:hypothetical protein CFP56_47729 [Quercus suber]